MIIRKIDKELSKRLKERRFKIGHCYSNSFKVFNENKDKNIECWVIGYCKHKDDFRAFRHGWNLNKDGEIVDVTLVDEKLDNYEYYEAFKFTLDEFNESDAMEKTTGYALIGFDIDSELKCIKKNNLYVVEEDLLGFIYPYI